jgi:hypothetical protein
VVGAIRDITSYSPTRMSGSKPSNLKSISAAPSDTPEVADDRLGDGGWLADPWHVPAVDTHDPDVRHGRSRPLGDGALAERSLVQKTGNVGLLILASSAVSSAQFS